MSWEPLVTYFSLQVVSTQVGGVPEVLPSDLIRLAEPNTSGYNTLVRPTWFLATTDVNSWVYSSG